MYKEPLLDCRCIDAMTLTDLAFALDVAKTKYEEMAKSFMERKRTTETGRYKWKAKRIESLRKQIIKMKVCPE